jgi:hypothetical protein
VRDTFDLPKVKAARKRLNGQFNKQEESGPFKKLRFIGLAYEAEEELDQLGLPGRGRLPDKNKLAIDLKTGKGKTGKGKTGSKTVKRPLPTLYRWLSLWTNPSIDILARFRKVFGTTFVTVSDKLRGLKDKLKAKLSDTFDKQAVNKSVGTSYDAVAVRAIGRALKAVAELVIPQTLRLVVEGLISGAKERLLAVLPLDVESLELEAAVKNEFSQFDFVIKKVEELQSGVEAKLDDIKEKLGENLSGLTALLKKASTVASMVKWAVRAIQCATPPGWGCLKLVFSSLTAWVAEKVLGYCPLQRKVACLISGIEFVQTGIPKAIANAVGKELNDTLSAIHPDLSPLFKELDSVPSINCNDIGCDGEPSELDLAFERLERELGERFGFVEAARMMDALLEISRVFGPGESTGLSAAEVDELRRLLLLYEITSLELELIADDLKRRIERGKEVRAATVEEFIEAVERFRQTFGAGGLAAGDVDATGESESGTVGGNGETVPSDTVESGEGEGVPTVEFRDATFEGEVTETAPRTRITVDNPDMILSIDDIPIKRITDVPIEVPKGGRTWRSNTKKTEMRIRYRLHKGVRFEHAVPSVSSPIVLGKGTVIPMTAKNSGRTESQGTEQE